MFIRNTILRMVMFSSMFFFPLAHAEDWKSSTLTLDSFNFDSLNSSTFSSEQFSIDGFPKRLQFKMIQPYAKDAYIQVLSDAGNHNLQPSKRFFLISNNTIDKVALSFNPETKTLNGHIHSHREKYHVNSLRHNQSYRLSFIKENDDDHNFDCANDNLNQWELTLSPPTQLINTTKMPTRLGNNPLYAAEIKVDTDNEFLWNKFNNNTTSARDWIEDLFVNMNLIYEAEVDLHLAIDSMVLRVDTTPANNPDFNQDPNGFNDGLSQFSNYWNGQNGNNNTVFTALLAGKDISGFSFSGIAWVYGYCSSQYGYSINRLGSSFPLSFASTFVGHEIGHNLGSSHTHCEQLANNGTQFVDQCYSNEQNGCYSGTTACPSGGQGTMMSYCHAPPQGFDGGGPAMGPPASPNCNISSDVHPLIANKFSNNLQANYPSCITDFVVLPDLIFANGLE